MKKIFYLLTILTIFFTINVYASNEIYSIKMNIYLSEDGNATITEQWDVKGDSGSEWFRRFSELGHSEVTNFKVSMDNIPLNMKEWNINESLEQKKGFYGTNVIDSGIELCFGMYDYNRHTYSLSYNYSNAIFNTNDAQLLYLRLIEQLNDIDVKQFDATINSFYSFPDDLDVWSTGYEGLNYAKNGIITLTNITKPDLNNKDYIVVLVKFPKNTFKTTNSYDMYESFDQVKKAYDEGKYDYNQTSIWSILAPIIGFGAITGGIIYLAYKNGYGYINNKKIKEKETPAFRDIPCKKDLFYANSLMKLNNFGYTATNIFGAVILKWVKENKITFIKDKKQGLFKEKEEYSLDLTKKPKFNNNQEEKIYNIMYEASSDGILEANEFKKWARYNAQKLLNLFDEIEKDEENKLRQEGHIYKRKSKDECSRKNVMDDMIYEDSKQLLGLKIFLKEFSEIDKRETIEVQIWDEYLMFAYIFGIADKVFAQLKKLYPEIIEQDINNYNTMAVASHFNDTAVNAAVSAARSYHGGSGGSSTGGGGGGSFGGGGVGSR